MSYGLYIGKNHTHDGIAYLGGYGDEPSSHWLEINPARNWPPGSMITVGVSEIADLPGLRSEIPQVAYTARNIRTSYSYYKGIPAPLTNGGLNEHGVAVRDIWSPSRPELVELTPSDQKGLNYSDLARAVVERAETARQGVQIMADLIAQYGEASYGGNSHIIADSDEAWVVIQPAGGQKLWAAEKLGPDSIRASRPGYIMDIPITQPDHPNFLYSEHLVSFAVDHGWFSPETDMSFNFNRIYGDSQGRWKGVQWIEDKMRQRAQTERKICLNDVMWAVRTEKLTGDTAGYGQVVPLVNPPFNELRVLWHAHTGAISSPFVPIFMGSKSVPPEFKMHRYLTSGESSRFMDPRKDLDGGWDTTSIVPQGIESTRSATAVFKRLMYLVLQHPHKFLAEVSEVWLALESRLTDSSKIFSASAEVLFENSNSKLAESCLSYFTETELMNALDLAEKLADSIEARSRVMYGTSDSLEHRSLDQIW